MLPGALTLWRPAVRVRVWLSAAAALAAALLVVDLRADEADAFGSATLTDLKKLSLEDLLTLEVTTVSRRPQPYAFTASALTVLTAEDIRRSTATTLADLMRLPTGLQTTQSGSSTWQISARGFNSSVPNKLLVLLDGRSLYTPLYSGVFWDAQDTVLEDLERIEIVRGPGAAMWGGNAVNGVVNFISKPARATLGTLVTVGGGNFERPFATLRQGVQLGSGTFARVYAKSSDRSAFVRRDGSSAGDAWQLRQAGFRVDAERPSDVDLTIQGDLYHGFLGRIHQPDSRISGWNVLSRLTSPVGSPDRTWRTQLYYDHVERTIPRQFGERRNTVDLDSQLNALWGAGRTHNFVGGINLRLSDDNTAVTGLTLFDPRSRRITIVSGFVQDEVSLLDDRVGLSAGAKFEHHSSVGFEFQPSVRGSFHPQKNQTLWAAVSRAVRTPTRLDDDIRFLRSDGTVTLRGNPDFRSETLTTVELGYRVHPAPRWSIDLNAYYNVYDELRSIEHPPDQPSTLANNLNARTYGAEVSIVGQLTPAWRMRAIYTTLRKHLDLDAGSTDTGNGSVEGDDPAQTFALSSQLDFGPDWECDVALRYVAALPQPAVPAYTTADVRVGWKFLPDWEISVVGRNLLDPQHREFGSSSEVPRSFYAKLTWRY